jgi:hypothetical protein
VVLTSSAYAADDKELLGLIDKLFHSKPVPCGENKGCYCLNHTPTLSQPLRFSKSRLCAEEIRANHIIGVSFTSWDQEGKKVDEGRFTNGKADGQWISWHPNGTKVSEVFFKDGKLNGPVTVWHDNGQISIKGQYNDDNPDGEWVYRDQEGKLTKQIRWDKGKLVTKEDGK